MSDLFEIAEQLHYQGHPGVAAAIREAAGELAHYRGEMERLSGENARNASIISDARSQLDALRDRDHGVAMALEPVLDEYDQDGDCVLPEIVGDVVADLLRCRADNEALRKTHQFASDALNTEPGLWLVRNDGEHTHAERIGSTADAEALKKLPRTRDGKLVVPGMTLYVLKYGRHVFSAENFHWKIDSYPDQAFVRGYWGTSGYDSDFRWSNCYSTREAAEAAEDGDG